MGRSSGYTSPCTRVRSLKRAINFFKSKGIANSRKVPNLTQEICASVDIPPQSLKPVLAVFVLPSVSISPYPMNYPQTKPSVSRPPSNLTQPFYLTLDLAKEQKALNFNQQQMLTKPQHSPDLLRCQECEKIFETKEDMKCHQQNKYGREDCIILQKMMLSNYYSKPVI